MRCLKNGVDVNFGHGHVYPEDMYQCSQCGDKMLATNGRPIPDPDYKTQDEYLNIIQPKDLK